MALFLWQFFIFSNYTIYYNILSKIFFEGHTVIKAFVQLCFLSTLLFPCLCQFQSVSGELYHKPAGS